MFLIVQLSRRPFITSELLLALYIFVFAALFGPVFSPLAKLLGYAAVAVFFVEIVLRNKVMDYLMEIRPIWPYAMFYVVMSFVVYPMLPYKGSLINNMTGFVAFSMVFYLVRKYRVLHNVDFSFLCVVIGIGSLYLVFPSLLKIDAASQERIKMSSSVLGTGDSGGLNASGVSLYCGLASFMALRCIATSGQGIRQFKGITSKYWKSWASLVCLAFSFILILGVSGSRQGLIWLVFVLIAAFAMRFKKNLLVSIVVSGFSGIFLLGILLLLFRDSELAQRTLILFDPTMMAIDPEKSLLTRLDMYKEGYRMWLESPLWGNGNEAFRAFSAWQGHYSHSNYVEILVNYGLLGFVFYYAPMVFLVCNALTMLAKGRPEYRTVLIWLIVAVVALLASGLFIPSFYRKLMVVFIAYLFGVYHNVKDDFYSAPRGVIRRPRP